MATICKALRIGLRNRIGDPWVCWQWMVENPMAEKKVERCFAPPPTVCPGSKMQRLCQQKEMEHAATTAMFPTKTVLPSSTLSNLQQIQVKNSRVKFRKSLYPIFPNLSTFLIPLLWISFLSIFLYFHYVYLSQSENNNEVFWKIYVNTSPCCESATYFFT